MVECLVNSRFPSCELVVWHRANTKLPDLYGNCKLNSTGCCQYLKNYCIFLLVLLCKTSALSIPTCTYFFHDFICTNKSGRSSGTCKCRFNALYLCIEPPNHTRISPCSLYWTLTYELIFSKFSFIF